jgi:DeoR family fructose operon transcriptional repressor
MNAPRRRKAMLEIIHSQDELSVKDLATKLAISEITIRRDLTILAEKGLISRTHGGAMKPDTEKRPVDFAGKQRSHNEHKEYIGSLAARYISDNDVIFMDCGSTVFTLCQHLIQLNSLTVITNSLPVVAEFLAYPQIKVNLVGGEVDHQRRAVHGLVALEHMARYRANKAFVGIDGISLANGLMAQSETEAETTKAMASRATETFLLCDSSKIEKEAYLQFAPLSLIQHLVTDTLLDKELANNYRAAGINLILE